MGFFHLLATSIDMEESNEASKLAGGENSKKKTEETITTECPVSSSTGGQASTKRQASPNEKQEIPSKIPKLAVAGSSEDGLKNGSLKSLQADSAKNEETAERPASAKKRVAPDTDVVVELPLKRSKRERENSDASYDDLNTDENDGKRRLRARKRHILKCILEQMEFYFSDSNLRTDRYLKKLIDTTTDGFIDLTVFENFNKLQALHKDGVSKKLLTQALKNSSLLEINKEETQVRRTTPIKVLTQEDVDARTVYVENLPVHANHDWLRTIFSKCGKVNYVSLPRYKSSKDIKGFAFVEFACPEEATKACTMLNNSENLEEKPGKFPKWNNTLYRLQRYVPVQLETKADTDSISADKKEKEKQEDVDSEGDGKKKKKKRTSKRKSNEGSQINQGEEHSANPKGGEGTETEKAVSSKEAAETKKKKKKKKRRNSQTKDENTTTSAASELSSSNPRTSTPKSEKTKNSKKEKKNVEGSESASDAPIDEKSDGGKIDSEGRRKKRKKKKKKKGESKVVVADATGNVSKETKDRPTDQKVSAPEVKETSQPSDKKLKERDTNSSEETNADNQPQQRLTAKERKRQRQADIRRKKELKMMSSEASDTHDSKIVNVDGKEAMNYEKLKTSKGSTTDKSEVPQSETEEFRGRRKSDGSELTSILKSKKAAERKKVEFDPVPILTEFEKTREMRKRKKVKREKLHLRVISKQEWTSLKAEYISRQKSHMAALKESLRELRQQEAQATPAKPQSYHVDLQDVFKTKRLQSNIESLQFIPNVVVQWKCTHELRRDNIRTMCKGISSDKIAYIDAPEEAKTGYIRFKDEASAEAFAKMSMGFEIFSARMLPVDQQQAYWDKANEDRKKKLKSSRNEQGCDKLARKVFERNKATFYNKPSRIVFNDDDGDDDNKTKENDSAKTDNAEESVAEIDKKDDKVISETTEEKGVEEK